MVDVGSISNVLLKQFEEDRQSAHIEANTFKNTYLTGYEGPPTVIFRISGKIDGLLRANLVSDVNIGKFTVGSAVYLKETPSLFKYHVYNMSEFGEDLRIIFNHDVFMQISELDAYLLHFKIENSLYGGKEVKWLKLIKVQVAKDHAWVDVPHTWNRKKPNAFHR